jgi:hypothetical protein
MPRRLRRLPIDVLVLSALIAAMGLCVPAVAVASHNFSDVPPGAGYHDFVDFLVQNGITSGCGAGVFCPNNAVTRGQMAIFLQKLAAALDTCPPDSVKSGPTCIDKYEASVWEVAPGNTALIQKIRAGTATLAELQAGGAQRGRSSGDLGLCFSSGGEADCLNLYAVSIAGVTPSRFINWFQATAAARNAGKRLPTNAEWQAAALGTPNSAAPTAPCKAASGAVEATGAKASCVSHVGAFDMIGNLWEWVADWVPRSTTCVGDGWFASLGVLDYQCLAGAATDGVPGALLRGGDFTNASGVGAYAVTGLEPPTLAQGNVGFRAAR